MEQQKEEKINNYAKRRRRRRQSSSMSKPNSSFPLDLVSEILVKLPAKSIVRSRCVSKLWSSITNDPYFINSFDNRYSPKPSLLMFYKKLDKLFVFSFSQQLENSPYSSYTSQPLHSYQMKCPQDLCFSSMESVHGLICFRFQNSTTPIIWNPTMRKFLTLPRFEKSWEKRTTTLLGYDPIAEKHKVLCMDLGEFRDECLVLTLGSSYWRKIKIDHYHRSLAFSYRLGRCINGVLYYIACLSNNQRDLVIMSFDVRSEKFQPITFPWDARCTFTVTYEGKLGFVRDDHANNGEGTKMWVLEDAEKHEWSVKSIRAPYIPYDEILKTKFILSGVTNGGEFIYVPHSFVKSFCILYFDPKRNSLRKVEFQGIVDEEFNLRYGLSDNGFQAFSNHIESLISF